MFIFFYYEYELSSSSSQNKLTCSSLVHFIVKQAWACSRPTWLLFFSPHIVNVRNLKQWKKLTYLMPLLFKYYIEKTYYKMKNHIKEHTTNEELWMNPSILWLLLRNPLIGVGAFSGRIGLPPAVMGWAASCYDGP